jgi:hypothetical protein
MEKPNRAERRRNKFGGGRSTDRGGWPTHQPNPVFGIEARPVEETGPGDQATADEAAPGDKAADEARAPRRAQTG